ncbi:MAG: restriction endonuclease subunit S [Anaerolineaceae bacterium]|jgi:type I restriction enzyme S subunit|nr:restriction endonuclease subunit S [Anaerolineaceae bacterium]
MDNYWNYLKLVEFTNPDGLMCDGDWIESKDQDPHGEVRLIQLADIGDGFFLNKSSRYLTYNKAKDLNCTFLNNGDILVARMPDPIGRACIFTDIGRPAISVVDVCIIRVNNSVVNRWLMYVINSKLIRNEIISRRGGSTRPRIARRELEALEIPTPPFSEQMKIADTLSTWDRAIERVQRLIEAKKRQKNQLVSRLLSGQKRFPNFQDEWKQVKLGTFLHPKFRKVVKPAGAYLRLGIRSHGKGTFTSVVDDPETIALTHLFQARKDDLIVNITFAWEGAIALVGPDGDGALVSHRFPTYVFVTSKMLPEYFKHLMVTDRFFYELDLISPGGAGRNRVMNKGDFLKITVTIPGVEEQKKIAGVLGGMDEQIALLKKYLEKLKEQKKGLMQKLLTGEIRVKAD